MSQEKTWYVYLLCYPDTEIPFYVGKGTGKRLEQHKASREDGNPEKQRIIQSIVGQGKQVLRKKIAEFTSEQDAFIYEWAMINVYHEYIVNIRPGGARVHLQTAVKELTLKMKKRLESKEYLTIDEIACYLGIRRATLHNYMQHLQRLQITPIKMGPDGRRKFFALADVKKMKAYREQPWTVKISEETPHGG